jgi:hypothetical protein
MKETVLTALLRRNKIEKVNEDSIFLEYQFNDMWLIIFATKEDDFEISELLHTENIKLTKRQKEDLQNLVYSKVVKIIDPTDEYFENGVRPENFY